MMTFDVEVLLRGTSEVVTETVTHDGPEPAGWTDADVREVLLSILRVFGRVSPDGGGGNEVSLRGLSWIVTDVDPGVAIAIEIPSGAVGAGPFDLPADELTQMIARVIALSTQPSQVH
jgi:hypothetical protein